MLSVILKNMVRPTKNKKILVILIIVFVAGATLLVLEKTHITNFYKKASSGSDDAKTTSTTKTAQEDYNKGDERAPGNSVSEDKGSGGIIDKNGSIDNNTDTSKPIVSKTGEISLYSPQSNTTVTQNLNVAGTSSLAIVSYRIIDDSSGVIATGDLKVASGKFSGSLSFDTKSNSGRLDIFATRADGSEYSNIEVPIKFN